MKRIAEPGRQVGAAGLAGAISVIVVWAVGEFGGVEIPPEIASAFTVVVSFICGALVKDPK